MRTERGIGILDAGGLGKGPLRCRSINWAHMFNGKGLRRMFECRFKEYTWKKK